jgi:serine/threonine-protein kinase
VPQLRAAEPHASPRSDAASFSSFPVRLRNRFRVRGPVLRAVDQAVRERYGDGARDRVVAKMPGTWGSDLRDNSINALVSYEIEMLDTYLDIATQDVVRDANEWRAVGRAAVDGQLATLLRHVVKKETDGSAFVRRGVGVWAKLFDFGAWNVSPLAAWHVELKVGEFDAASRPLRLWLVGMIEQSARRAAGPDLSCAITRGEMSFTPELVCDLAFPR